jgi:4-hydroxybenzoate polyprenyltransferase
MYLMAPFSYPERISHRYFVSHIWDILSLKARDSGEFLLYSSLFLGIVVIGMGYTSCYIQGITWTVQQAAVMSMITFSVYNLNRKTDEAEDALNHERRFRITKKFERHFFIAALAAYLIALTISVFYGVFAFCVAILPLVSGIFYSVPILPQWCRYRRLKEIPVMKNVVVSTSWAFSATLLPVFMTGSVMGTSTLLVFLFTFSWTFIASTLPDIRDRAGDSATGVATIPVLIGVARTRFLLTGINLISGVLIFTLGRSVLPIGSWVVIICSLVYSQVCIVVIDRTRMNNLLVDVISDGQFLAIGGLCLLVSSLPNLYP